MPSYNKVIIIGNLTRDPELVQTQESSICKMNIAVNEKWNDKGGIKQEKAHFFGCVSFGRTAENIGKHCRKGELLMLEGRLAQERWEDKETGKSRDKTIIRVETFEFMGQKGTTVRDSPMAPTPAPRPAQPSPEPRQEPKPEASPAYDDDVPF